MDGGGYLIAVWLVYAAASIGLTYCLARTLFKHGAVFLGTVFKETPELAHSVNVLLVVGFYMLNLGYAALLLRPGSFATTATAVSASAYLVNKLGVLLVSLGVIHFVNMAVIYRIGRERRPRRAPAQPPQPASYWGPPVAPAAGPPVAPAGPVQPGL